MKSPQDALMKTAVESLRRGMSAEDKLSRRDAEAYHQAIHGNRAGHSVGGDDVGDIVIYGDYNGELPKQPQPKTDLLPQPEKKSHSFLKIATIAALAGGTAGAPLWAPAAIKALGYVKEKVESERETEPTVGKDRRFRVEFE